MTITELHIQFDLQPENRIDILEVVAIIFGKGYLFVDSSDGHCYLFDENGNENDIKKLKNIDSYAFYGCKSLESIKIPDSVENIGYWSFAYCRSLESIIISDSVKSIKDYAFAECESLKSIKIPGSIESIGKCAFAFCESLRSVSFKGKTMKQVKKMENYPFGIVDKSIIRCV